MSISDRPFILRMAPLQVLITQLFALILVKPPKIDRVLLTQKGMDEVLCCLHAGIKCCSHALACWSCRAAGSQRCPSCAKRRAEHSRRPRACQQSSRHPACSCPHSTSSRQVQMLHSSSHVGADQKALGELYGLLICVSTFRVAPTMPVSMAASWRLLCMTCVTCNVCRPGRACVLLESMQGHSLEGSIVPAPADSLLWWGHLP